MNSSPVTGGTYRELLDEMYAWCEGLCRADVQFTDDDVGRFWTADARMVTNGKVEAAGIPELSKHFALFPQKYRRVEVRRPFRRYLEAGNTVVIEYEIVGELRAGERAIATRETTRQHVRVIAVFTMRDGRVAEMREVAAANAGDA
jgi:ketosteroid isomerase-like protein